jgi:hypothetical protein
MKTILIILLACPMALCCGCFSIDVASNQALSNSALSPSDGEPAEHVLVSNYGWLLFNRFPLVCGNGDPDGWLPWSFFCDYISPEFLHNRFMKYASDHDANVRDLTFYRDEEIFFNIPGMDPISIPIPYLICFREIQFSGVLTYRNTHKKAVTASNGNGDAK